MQRKLSEQLVLVFPGLLLAIGLAFLVFQMNDQSQAEQIPTFEKYVTAEIDSPWQPESKPKANTAAHLEVAPKRSTLETAPSGNRDELNFAALPEEVVYSVVIRDENGLPVANAPIELIERSRLHISNAKQSTSLLRDLARTEHRTGKDGDYRFTDRSNSAFEIEVHVPGYASKRYRLVDPGRRVIRLVRDASILGTVYGPDGNPLAGIDVQIWHDSNSMEVVKTDERGFYRFSAVTPTSATIRINDPRFRRAHEHRIKLDGRTEYQQDFYLTCGDDLLVKVTDSDGEFARRAFVSLVELDTGLEFGSVVTNDEGQAKFHCLEPQRSYLVRCKSGKSTGRTFVQKENGGNASEAHVQLRRAKTFFGVVHVENGEDLPIGGVEVVFESVMTRTNAEQQQIRVMTDENGAFSIDGLDPTLDYTAFLFHPAYAVAVEQHIQPEMAGDGITSDIPEEPTVFTMGEPSRFDGQVMGKDGLPISRGYITLDNTKLEAGVTGSRFSVRPDKAGRFSFSNLGTGSYDLTIRDLITGDVSQEIRITVGNGVVELDDVGSIVGPLIVDLAKN